MATYIYDPRLGWANDKQPPVTQFFHVETDCATGVVTYTQLESAELLAQRAGSTQSQLEVSAQASAEATELATLRARGLQDPVFGLLLKRLGIS